MNHHEFDYGVWWFAWRRGSCHQQWLRTNMPSSFGIVVAIGMHFHARLQEGISTRSSKVQPCLETNKISKQSVKQKWKQSFCVISIWDAYKLCCRSKFGGWMLNDDATIPTTQTDRTRPPPLWLLGTTIKLEPHGFDVSIFQTFGSFLFFAKLFVLEL